MGLGFVVVSDVAVAVAVDTDVASLLLLLVVSISLVVDSNRENDARELFGSSRADEEGGTRKDDTMGKADGIVAKAMAIAWVNFILLYRTIIYSITLGCPGVIK